MAHAYMPRRNVQYHFRDEEWVETRVALTKVKAFHLLVKGSDTAYSAAPDYASAFFVYFIQVKTRVLQGLISHRYRKVRETVKLSGLFLVKIIQRVKALYLTGKSSSEPCCIKQS